MFQVSSALTRLSNGKPSATIRSLDYWKSPSFAQHVYKEILQSGTLQYVWHHILQLFNQQTLMFHSPIRGTILHYLARFNVSQLIPAIAIVVAAIVQILSSLSYISAVGRAERLFFRTENASGLGLRVW